LTTLYENVRKDSNSDEHFVQLTVLHVTGELFSPFRYFIMNNNINITTRGEIFH